MTISETIAYLQQFSKSGKPVKDLSRMQSLLEELGNPQEQLRFVHIAGTNGKVLLLHMFGSSHCRWYPNRTVYLALCPALSRPDSGQWNRYFRRPSLCTLRTGDSVSCIQGVFAV